MSSFPKITINDVNNTNLDSVTKQITGLQDDQVYNIRAILKNNSTNQQVIIPRVLDDTGPFLLFLPSISFLLVSSVSSFSSLVFASFRLSVCPKLCSSCCFFVFPVFSSFSLFLVLFVVSSFRRPVCLFFSFSPSFHLFISSFHTKG